MHGPPEMVPFEFEGALHHLVTTTSADGAIFCDYEGEAIAVAASDANRWDLMVLGAQFAAWVLQLQRIARDSTQPERLSLLCVTTEKVLLVEALPGGYYVLATTSPGRVWARTRRALELLAERFREEL